MDPELMNAVLVSWQGALTGATSRALRGITVRFIGRKKVHLICYFDGDITEDDREDLEVAETEVYADFATNALVIDIEFVRCDFPRKMKSLNFWIYLRKEDVGYIDEGS